MKELVPTRHAAELDAIVVRMKSLKTDLFGLSDEIHSIAMAEGLRDAAGRALRAPFLSMDEFSAAIRDVRRAIPHEDVNKRSESGDGY